MKVNTATDANVSNIVKALYKCFLHTCGFFTENCRVTKQVLLQWKQDK